MCLVCGTVVAGVAVAAAAIRLVKKPKGGK